MDGKALGTMRMDMIFTLEEVFHALRIVFSWGVISFVLLLPYFSLAYAFKRWFKTAKVKGKAKNG